MRKYDLWSFPRDPPQRKWGERLPLPAASRHQHRDGERLLPERPMWSELQWCRSGHDAVCPRGAGQWPRRFSLRGGLQLHPQGPSGRIHQNDTGTQVRLVISFGVHLIRAERSRWGPPTASERDLDHWVDLSTIRIKLARLLWVSVALALVGIFARDLFDLDKEHSPVCLRCK